MEFSFDINQLFPERVSILDQTIVSGPKSALRPDLQAHIATVIDELGRASAKAQQLPAAITSASKLQTQRHQLYLLKDGESNGGRGVVVGFLKVGYKKLFLLDRQGEHVEAEPLCVLDFYIAENMQRHGYGLELFDFMLQHKNLEPVLMAYDRPSPKFLSFLAKHYCLTPSVPQANNFVVYEGFFRNRSGSPSSPLTDQGMYGFFGTSGRAGSSLAVCSSSLPPAVGILPVLPVPQRGILPQQNAPTSRSSFLPWEQQGPEPTVPSNRALQNKTHQPTGSSCQIQPVQPAHGQQSCWTAGQTIARKKSPALLPHVVVPCASSGLRPVGDQPHALGYTDTHRLASSHRPQSRSQPLTLPPLFASKDGLCSKRSSDSRETPLGSDAEACGAEEEKRVLDSGQPPARGTLVSQGHVSEKESDRNRRGWSWTVGENCYTAQWVKKKQDSRSTRPW
ncbi:alpha-tubulin N-acetyltransferase 1 isoform X2 [Perca fluviatilis]|uniref:alpha-tubulin N-acetyltransferase 1 isoform X2 n=1 Tax=Perca fluviatilis TaxID=8168 RepID=UPI00196425A6|nr:alpha-tubulin N-acetyltransferase 1 isoform X2 [Perca fluviatilis]